MKDILDLVYRLEKDGVYFYGKLLDRYSFLVLSSDYDSLKNIDYLNYTSTKMIIMKVDNSSSLEAVVDYDGTLRWIPISEIEVDLQINVKVNPFEKKESDREKIFRNYTIPVYKPNRTWSPDDNFIQPLSTKKELESPPRFAPYNLEQWESNRFTIDCTDNWWCDCGSNSPGRDNETNCCSDGCCDNSENINKKYGTGFINPIPHIKSSTYGGCQGSEKQTMKSK